MVADRRHNSENNKPISIMSNQLRIITINDMDFFLGGGDIGKFTKIIGKIGKEVNHESQGK